MSEYLPTPKMALHEEAQEKAREKYKELAPYKRADYETLYLYVITNPAWDDWCKIGVAGKVSSRLLTYQTSSPHRDYVCSYYVKVHGLIASLLEKFIHDKITDLGFERKNEWFRISIKEAVENIREEVSDGETIILEEVFNE